MNSSPFFILIFLFSILLLATCQAGAESTGYWKDMGDSLFYAGKGAEALEPYALALKIDKNESDIWYNEGLIYKEMEKYSESIKAFDEVIRIEPNNTDALNAKAKILTFIGRNSKAVHVYDQVLQIDPKNSEARQSRKIILNKRDTASESG